MQWVGQFVGHRRWGRNHLGITVPDCLNLFITCGPGTVLGHGGSYITIAECQVRYIVDLIGTMAREGLGAMECKPEVEQDYVRRHDDAHSRMIWTHDGMDNWYRNNAGRVVTGSVVGGGLLGRYRDPCRTAVTAVP